MAKITTPIPDAVLRAQHQASSPKRNVWLSANAGSGKTHVLTERVIRLLLAGVDPAQILCLTYTKAAASVMQTRIFERLSQWTRLSDEELNLQLIKLEGGHMDVDATRLMMARRLFARALESPGGLKIQTIHAFCESILHQFPLEANIAGHFDILDDIAASDLMRQARREVIETAWHGEDRALLKAFELVLAHVGENGLNALFDEAINRREALQSALQKFDKIGREVFYQALHLDIALDENALARELKREALFTDEDIDLLQRHGGTVTRNFVAALQELKLCEDVRQFIPLVLKTYFDAKGGKRSCKNILTKNLQKAAPEMEAYFIAKQEHLTQLVEKWRILSLINLNEAAYRLISRLNKIYTNLKRARGLLDFDDLIHRTLALLQRSHANHWVHYKLDRAITHILVDEAQDTSPAQWQIIRSLVDEFFAGVGANEAERTLFAVGDEKQSIYSFQGAVPEDFASFGAEFGKKARSASRFFDVLRLDFSFRSTPDILAAVDHVFSVEANYHGLSGAHERPIHQAIRAQDPGEVDIWAPLHPIEGQEPQDWRDTQAHQDTPAIMLARQIAETIAGWLVKGETITGQGRLMRPGDIMVLVRSRDQFVHALSRELKNRAIAVAGADRLHLNKHIAVRDLMALGRFVLQPFDDLSLACVLKSPLFGLDEDELYQLAQPRQAGERLYQSLERQRSDNIKFEAAYTLLTRCRSLADVVPVYEFYSYILSEEGGRRKFLSRLGHEASEVLEAFMDYALLVQKTNLPGLQSFIETLDQSAPEIKRELGTSSDEVQIMTVHAAKGQEAAVVFLVDNGKQIWNANRAPKFIDVGRTRAKTMNLWNPGKKYRTSALEAALDGIKHREEQEYRRLLYVGMTRAEDRLIVCGYRSKKTPPGTWLEIVSNALNPQSTSLVPAPAQGVEARRFRLNPGKLPLYRQEAEPQKQPPPPPPPAFLFEKISPPPSRPRPIMPSGADIIMLDDDMEKEATVLPVAMAATSTPRTTPSLAIRRGLITHQLLQYLPDIAPSDRAKVTQDFINRQLSDAQRELKHDIAHDVLTLLQDSRLQRLFAPSSRAEVALTGTIESNGVLRPVVGQIDRLSVFEDEILLADFKTGQPPLNEQAIAKNYLSQMALYRHMLRDIYPHHEICALLIYTRTKPAIFQLDNEKLDQLLEKL